MAGKSVAFKMADLKRAVQGASKGGMKIGRAEIDPSSGKIILIAESEGAGSGSPLDDWLKRHEG